MLLINFVEEDIDIKIAKVSGFFSVNEENNTYLKSDEAVRIFFLAEK